MRELRQIPISDLRPDPDQPRKEFEEAVILAMADSLRAIGVQVPLIVIEVGGEENTGRKKYLILDGECRFRAATIAGLADLPCIVLKHRPSAEEMLDLRLGIDINRSNLKPMERAHALSDYIQLRGCTLVEACKRCGMSQSLGSKLVALQRLAPELQQKVNEGWDIERAYVISGEPDHDKQRALAAQSGLSRGELRRKAKGKVAAVESKPTVSRFVLPTGAVISVQAGKPTLNNVIESLLEVIKQLKRAQAESLDLATAVSVLRDKARSVN